MFRVLLGALLVFVGILAIVHGWIWIAGGIAAVVAAVKAGKDS